MAWARLFLVLLVYLGLGSALSLSQTWWSIYFYENVRTSYWRPRVLQYPYMQGGYDPSTTGLMLGKPNGNDDAWVILGIENRDGRVFQVRRYISGDIGINRNIEPGSIPKWSRAFLPPTQNEVEQRVHIHEQMNGWPFLAWRGEYVTNGNFLASEQTNCIPDDRSVGMNAWHGLILFPYGPVFPGILYNAIIFGGILFITVRIIKHTRRRITEHVRLSRHQCTKCKYNITGLATCPECGQVVTIKA